MKIAIDIRAAGGNPSGVGLFALSLVRSLARIDHDNRYLLCSNRDVELPFELPGNFCKCIIQMPISNLWLQTALPLTLVKEKADVFHGTNFVVPLLCRTPRVVTVYDLTPHMFPDLHSRGNTLVQKLVPASVRASKRVIAVSDHTKRDLMKLWNVPEEKIDVVPGAPGEEFVPITDEALLLRFKKQHNLPDRFLLAVGTLEPRKNLTTVFEAFHKLRRNGGSDLKLVIVGEKGWRFDPIFKSLGDLDLKEHVVFTGYQDWKTLPYFYNLAQVLVYPSLYEGFGLPPLEAMACGTPAVVADNSSLPEVVPDPRLRVAAKDSKALADTLAHLLDDEAFYQQASCDGRKHALKFHWDEVAKSTLATYREACRQ